MFDSRIRMFIFHSAARYTRGAGGNFDDTTTTAMSLEYVGRGRRERREGNRRRGRANRKEAHSGWGGEKADSNKKAYRGGYRTGTGKEREREGEGGGSRATRLVYKAEVGGYRQYSTLLRTLLGL